MKASLRLEAIGDDATGMGKVAQGYVRAIGGSSIAHLFGVPSRAWCAQITGTDTRYGLRRRFLFGKKDYAHANGSGSRGVYVYFTLESGQLYEVMAPQSWKRRDRYFCTVGDDGGIVRLSEEEARQWLQRPSSDH